MLSVLISGRVVEFLVLPPTPRCRNGETWLPVLPSALTDGFGPRDNFCQQQPVSIGLAGSVQYRDDICRLVPDLNWWAGEQVFSRLPGICQIRAGYRLVQWGKIYTELILSPPTRILILGGWRLILPNWLAAL